MFYDIWLPSRVYEGLYIKLGGFLTSAMVSQTKSAVLSSVLSSFHSDRTQIAFSALILSRIFFPSVIFLIFSILGWGVLRRCTRASSCGGRKREDWGRIRAGNVGMYECGPRARRKHSEDANACIPMIEV